MRTIDEIEAELCRERKEYREFCEKTHVESPAWGKKIENLMYELNEAKYAKYRADERDKSERASITIGISPGRLREICDAERDGRCVVMPCKVGDTLCETYEEGDDMATVDEIEISICTKMGIYSPEDIGESVIVVKRHTD